MSKKTTPDRRWMQISNVRYRKLTVYQIAHDFEGPGVRATFALTNGGPSTFQIDVSTPDLVRFKTEKGWQTEFNEAKKHPNGLSNPNGRLNLQGYQILRSGDGVECEVELPANTRRWQVGYHVMLVSQESDVKTKFGDKLGKTIINVFGNRISDEEGLAEAWGPIIEMKDTINTHAESLHPAR